jgi:hypothetical protein
LKWELGLSAMPLSACASSAPNDGSVDGCSQSRNKSPPRILATAPTALTHVRSDIRAGVAGASGVAERAGTQPWRGRLRGTTKVATSLLALPEDMCLDADARDGYEASVHHLAASRSPPDNGFTDGAELQTPSTPGALTRVLDSAARHRLAATARTFSLLRHARVTA